jgi:hypothetical protein
MRWSMSERILEKSSWRSERPMTNKNSPSLRAAASLLPALLATAALAESVTDQLWQEAVVSVTDLDRSAEFFREIGGYTAKWRGALDESAIAAWGLEPAASGEALVLAPAAATSGYVRLGHRLLLQPDDPHARHAGDLRRCDPARLVD